jgi:hypothetical protein
MPAETEQIGDRRDFQSPPLDVVESVLSATKW